LGSVSYPATSTACQTCTESETGSRAYFGPTEVDEYPAVFLESTDFRSDGSCNIAVGISDTLVFRLAEDGNLGVKSCDRAKLVASMVLQTVRSGG
jgi:hypothetical protein